MTQPKKRKISAKQALECYRLWIALRKMQKPVKGLAGALLCIQLHAQTLHVSAGMGINYPAAVVATEFGHRVGPLYGGIRAEYRSNNYPALAVQPIIGLAGSWNNNKLHELTTMLYGFRSQPLAYRELFKNYPYQPWGVGIRHYVHESYYDLSLCNGTVTITMGFQLFRQVYR